MRRLWTVLLAIALVSGSSLALAQEGNPGERLLEEKRRQRQMEELAHNRAGQVITTPDVKGPVREAMCFPIDKIVLTGVTVFLEDKFGPVLAEFSGQCLGQVSIGNLLARISAIYSDEGFITTRAYVPAQDISARKLTIEVLEGRIEAFVYSQVDDEGVASPGRPRKIKSAFPLRPGDVLQLRDLEHGLEQMNRLRSSQANANLIVGEAPGTSRIVITERKADLIRGTFGFNNRGSESSGRMQLRFGLEAEDLLSINDSWALAYSGSENTNALVFNISAPYRKWLISLNGSYSEELSPVTVTSDLFTQNASLNLTVERLLMRNARTKYVAYTTANSSWSERFINIAALTPQHRSVLRFGLRHEHRMEKAVISADTSVSFGAKFLGADWDAPKLSAGSPRTGFRKLGTRVTYIRPFDSGRQLSIFLAGQIANATLYSTEQLSIGGWESVRGYSGFEFSGDGGAFLRTELSFSATALDLRKLGASFVEAEIWNPFDKASGGFRPFVFADAGFAKARVTGQSATMLSAGFGFSTQVGLATLNGTLAVPLKDQGGQSAGSVQAFLGLTVKLF